MYQKQNKNDKEKKSSKRPSNLQSLFEEEEVRAVLVYENGKRYTQIISTKKKS